MQASLESTTTAADLQAIQIQYKQVGGGVASAAAFVAFFFFLKRRGTMTLPGMGGGGQAVQAVLMRAAPAIIMGTAEVKEAAVAYIHDILDRAACVPPK